MTKILVTLVLALFVGQATGARSALTEGTCREQCPKEERGGPCLPGCPDCACCGVARVVMKLPATLCTAAPQIGFVSPRAEDVPAAPDPEEIVHIPKRPLV